MNKSSRCLAAVLAVSLVAPFADAAPKKKPAPAADPPAAPAAPPAPPSLGDTLTGDAKSDYDSGKLLFGDHDYAGAGLKFQSAYDKSHDVRLLWNIAACEKNQRHYARVLVLVRQYLRDGDATLAQSDKDEANDLIKTIEPFTATLTVTVDQPAAEVFLDEQKIGDSPVDPRVVDLGVHHLRISKTDFKDFRQDLSVGGSPTVTVNATLERLQHEGRLVVNAGGSDTITVDGARIATGTWMGVLPSGGHQLRVTAKDHRPYQADVMITDNETRTLAITLDKEKSTIPAWVWIGGGVLVAGGLALAGYEVFKPSDTTASAPVGNLDPGQVTLKNFGGRR